MKVLNFGSLNIDRVYQTPHIVRPGETLSSARMDTFAGGKGLNQSIALARAGVPVAHAGKVGEDGAFLLELLAQSGADVSQVGRSPQPTGHAVIQVEPGGQNCILLFGGANQDISPQDVDAALAGLERGDVLLLQNEISSLDYLLGQAGARGLRVALNPSPISPALLRCELGAVRWFLLNEIEGAALSGEQEPEAICRALRAKYPGSTVVLTVGSKGAYCDDGSGLCHCPAFETNVVDTTAAGDTFTGYFLSGVLAGLPAAACLRLGCAASTLAVSRPGAAPSIPLRAEVDAFMATLG